ncbi:hypothetical protein HYV73_00900 [Candidatus Uhrbacteria bacterium]|nr:hypothetical protein [Candidatus Uhrbacteria bacterium]
MSEIPQIIKDVGFDFSWDEKKVWVLDLPVTEMNIGELEWHFDIPFLSEYGKIYNLKPRDVMDHPDQHQEEYDRTMAADMQYPIEIMENKGCWLILDGLHRLMKAHVNGQQTVQVRIVPRDVIPRIISDS